MRDIWDLPRIEPGKLNLILPDKKGIYFWFQKEDDRLVYIGIALGKKGLKGRILKQHLNPGHLDFREDKQNVEDAYQLEHAVAKTDDQGNTLKGIDKGFFRKAIAREKHLKPGAETVDYIKNNYYLKYWISDDSEELKRLEETLIVEHSPLYNSVKETN